MSAKGAEAKLPPLPSTSFRVNRAHALRASKDGLARRVAAVTSWTLIAQVPAWLAAAMALAGIAQAAAGGIVVRRFAARAGAAPRQRPALTVLKPLHGAEPMLYEALASFAVQDYPAFQLVFGVADPDDPALAAVARLRAAFPGLDVTVVANPAQHGSNRKISNLVNMLPAARHDLLVIADSDLHVSPDYLDRVVAELEQPGAGLVTTLYAGWAAARRLPERLGASQITYNFLPGALLGRALGRQDCLGVTMALHRETLDRAGGLQAVADHVADDAVLGRLVCAQGLAIRLAATLPATTVSDRTIAACFWHELRWARTIRSLAPAAFTASIVQHPTALAALAALLSGGAAWSLALFLAAWATRAGVAYTINRALAPMLRGCAHACALGVPPWLLPLRELMSVCVMLASYRSRRVVWRGHTMYVGRPPVLTGSLRWPAQIQPGSAATRQS